MAVVQFGTRTYAHPSLPISAQRAVNMFAEKQPPDAKTPVALLGSPGLVEFANLAGSRVRGFTVMGGVLYAVGDTTLYSVSSAGVVTALGGAVSGTDPVSMDNNGTQICIVNGTNGYIYSVAGGFTLISDSDFAAAKTVRFFNQRFVYDETGTGRIRISASLDGTTHEALAFSTAESRPDNMMAVEVLGQILYLFGEKTIELYQDVGAPNFPFERIPGAVIERGLAASQCVAKEDGAIFFLGDDRMFYRISGQQAQRVSDHGAEWAWEGYTTVSDAFAFGWTFAGHKFVTVTFPTENKTWEFDISVGAWHERESHDSNGNSLGRWRANCYAECYGKKLVGDAFSGKVGYLDEDTYTEFGNQMIGFAAAPPIHGERARIFHRRIELDVESGVGIASGQGSDPQIMLDYSDDGGRTYSSRQMWRSMGRGGQYRKRLRWLRMGQSRSRIYRVSISDPVRRTIIAAHVDAKPGLS